MDDEAKKDLTAFVELVWAAADKQYQKQKKEVEEGKRTHISDEPELNPDDIKPDDKPGEDSGSNTVEVAVIIAVVLLVLGVALFVLNKMRKGNDDDKRYDLINSQVNANKKDSDKITFKVNDTLNNDTID